MTKKKPIPHKEGQGRPPYEPTEQDRDTVKACSLAGISHEDICKMIRDPKGNPIARMTLYKHFEKELHEPTIKATSEIAESLYKKAKKGDTQSMIFWMKTRAKWKETSELITKNETTLDFNKIKDMTEEEAKELWKKVTAGK